MKHIKSIFIVVLSFLNILLIAVLTFSSLLNLSYIRELEVLSDRIAILEEQKDFLVTIVKTEQNKLINVDICSTSNFKSWMDYKAITSKTSAQYILQTKASTNDEGFRVVNDRVLVAMGPQYGPVGSEYTIIFEDGQKVDVMIGDIKHEGCNSSRDGSMIEFIVDKNLMSKTARRLGNYNFKFKGSILEILKEELNI